VAVSCVQGVTGLLTVFALSFLAGKQQVPGVYLASSTALCQQDSQADDGDSYAAGLAALSGPQPERGSSSSPHSNQGGIGRTGSPVQHAPLMHAGRPTRLGSPVAMRPQQQQQQQGVGPIAAGVQEEGDGGQQPGAGSSSNSIKDVYGQPRVVSPALPATYSKVTQPVLVDMAGHHWPLPSSAACLSLPSSSVCARHAQSALARQCTISGGAPIVP
jgi:hypothetical protein